MTDAHSDDQANLPGRLAQRLACNQAGATDFGPFVQRLLAATASDEVLDLGPGTGAQMLPLAAKVRRIVGLDRSLVMVEGLAARLSAPRARVIVGDMDDLAEIDVAGPFSLIYAVYSLHYAADPWRVVHTAAGLLDGPGARLVVVTPEVGNNASWFADLGQLYELPADTLAVPSVGQRVFLPALRAACRTVTRAVLESDIVFATLDTLMQYYDACPHYCRLDRHDDARRHFARHFAREGRYRITKRSLGLVGRP